MIQIIMYSLLALVLAVVISKAGASLRAYDEERRASRPQALIDEERGYHKLENLDFFASSTESIKNQS